MKRLFSVLVSVALLLSFSGSIPAHAVSGYSVIPTFSIVSVVTDTSVTIRTYNFPAGDSFNVLMGYMGTRGVGGIQVATIGSGGGGSFTATFSIPAALQGQYQIAIRLQSNTSSGFYAYNWFYNDTFAGGGGSGSSGSGYYGIPSFKVTGVARDVSVTIQTNNFPASDSFDVLMGYMGTRGVGGIKVDTVSSGAGGTLTWTFNIPAALKGQYQIAIRLQSNTGSGFYAYNWFYNNTTGGNTGGPIIPGYTGYPTFSIASVVRNSSVTIQTYNLPPSNQFQVTMGPMGTRGINGYIVDTINSGAGGSQAMTFTIPSQLNGSHQISIRLQSISGSGHYAYNWFYNNTTP
jgi:hypothetical protein